MPNVKSTAADLDVQISRIANGDKSALADLYHCVYVSVYSYSLSILKSRQDAQDVLQDTFLDIWRSAPNYKSLGKPMAWIITIAQKRCTDILRTRLRFSDEMPNITDNGDGLTSEDKLLIHTCIETLEEKERQVVILHAISGLKHREISKILNIPLSTALSRYNRAIKKIRKTLEGEFL